MSDERIARMNPDAVDTAKVYTGPVHFHDGENVEMEGVPFVEVGKWATAGAEKTSDDFDCSYYAALFLGYELSMDWLPASQNKNGDRKYLIYKNLDENSRPVPFSPEAAYIIASQINFLLAQARMARQEFMPEDIRS
ncbi:MAG: hypothetical protein ABI758_07165 [Candidatus Woesebacteria bacterium]